MRIKNLAPGRSFWQRAHWSLIVAISLLLSAGLGSSVSAATKYRTLHRFEGPDGDGPEAGLIFDQAGNLYGTTRQGGSYGVGTVFELTPVQGGGWKEIVLHSF